MTTIRRQRITYYDEEVPKTIEGFKKWQFSSGSSIGPDFKSFSLKFRNWLRKNIPGGTQLYNYNRGHYIISGFIERNGKYVYFSVGDVRFSHSWSTNILIRTAKSVKDYTGGSNNYTTLERFSTDVDCLLNR